MTSDRNRLALLLLASGLALLLCNIAPQTEALPWPFLQSSSTTSTTTTTTNSLIRLRANRVRRPEWCVRDSLPRKQDELPQLVAIGRVKEVYLSGADQPTLAGQTSSNSASQLGADSQNNRALVTLSRIIKGKRELVNSDIIISGFNSSNPTHSQCPNFVKPNDTLILLLQPSLDGFKYTIQGGNLLSMNLQNLDRINALATGEPLKRREPIVDILCEAHYCAYGRCKILDPDRGQVKCECPDSCPSLAVAPVCGSDNTTYSSECHLIREGCLRRRPLFVTKESAC